MTDIFDRAFSFARVVKATVSGAANQVLANLRGFQDGAADTDADAEGSTLEPLYGSIGVISRPRDPDASGVAEVLAARMADNLQPIAGRDLRISTARGNVNAGSIGIAGYAGGFLALEDTAAKTSNILMGYVPFPGSPATKAHVFTLDTTEGNESVVLVHGAGHGIVCGKDKVAMIRNAAGDGWIGCGDNGPVISGDCSFNNNVLVGVQTDPLFQGVMCSVQLLAWIAQVNSVIAALATHTHATAGTGTPSPPAVPLVPPTAVPVATNKIKTTPL